MRELAGVIWLRIETKFAMHKVQEAFQIFEKLPSQEEFRRMELVGKCLTLLTHFFPVMLHLP
jgi:hypothetical protein